MPFHLLKTFIANTNLPALDLNRNVRDNIQWLYNLLSWANTPVAGDGTRTASQIVDALHAGSLVGEQNGIALTGGDRLSPSLIPVPSGNVVVFFLTTGTGHKPVGVMEVEEITGLDEAAAGNPGRNATNSTVLRGSNFFVGRRGGLLMFSRLNQRPGDSPIDVRIRRIT